MSMRGSLYRSSTRTINEGQVASVTPILVPQNPRNLLNPRDGEPVQKGRPISTQKAAAMGCSSIKLKRLPYVSMNHEVCNLEIFVVV